MVGMILMENLNKIFRKNLDKYFEEVDDGVWVTVDKERVNCYTLVSHNRERPLTKRQDTYVLTRKDKMTQDYIKLRETTSKGYKETYPYDGVELSRKGCSSRRGVSHNGMTGSLNTSDGSWGVLMNDYRIRKLTPVECERLQGFPDGWTEEGADGLKISDTQRYKCLGNAVTTNVITWIVDNWDFKVDSDGE